MADRETYERIILSSAMWNVQVKGGGVIYPSDRSDNCRQSRQLKAFWTLIKKINVVPHYHMWC